jgi:hypothetical protein
LQPGYVALHDVAKVHPNVGGSSQGLSKRLAQLFGALDTKLAIELEFDHLALSLRLSSEWRRSLGSFPRKPAVWRPAIETTSRRDIGGMSLDLYEVDRSEGRT